MSRRKDKTSQRVVDNVAQLLIDALVEQIPAIELDPVHITWVVLQVQRLGFTVRAIHNHRRDGANDMFGTFVMTPLPRHQHATIPGISWVDRTQLTLRDLREDWCRVVAATERLHRKYKEAVYVERAQRQAQRELDGYDPMVAIQRVGR
jgi:hypothetical protein